MLEEPVAFHEERTLLLVEGLIGREVERGRISLHLTEIGLDGGIEGQVGRDTVLQIQPYILESFQLLGPRGGSICGAGNSIREELELTRRGDARDAFQAPEPAHEPGCLASQTTQAVSSRGRACSGRPAGPQVAASGR